MEKRLFTIAAAALLLSSCGTSEAPSPCGAVPSPAQLEWQRMETNLFCHFGPNTFTAAEWGDGKESEDIFNPSDLDCNQWAAIAEASGFKGMIITAKHHDGFCLWPNPESTHTVAQSSWRDGKGDVLKEFTEACRAHGLKCGVYVSPWDRNHPAYGTPEYNGVFARTLEHIYNNYGEFYEQWFDGACGEGPDGRKQVYDWPLFNGTVARMEPQTIIFSDGGPGCRWVGNERGFAGRTNWSTLPGSEFYAGIHGKGKELNEGVKGAPDWIPAEVDVSIRPGWFWKESETPDVKTVGQLLTIWYNSVGRNSLLLLNIPPDNRGRFDAADSLRLMEFRAALDEIQSVNLADGARIKADAVRGRNFRPSNILDNDIDTYWCAPDGVTSASLEIRLPEERSFNRLMLQEYIRLGQRVEKFSVEIPDGEGWKKIADETTIGYKRIVILPDVAASCLRINIESALACPTISNLALYQDNILDYKD